MTAGIVLQLQRTASGFSCGALEALGADTLLWPGHSCYRNARQTGLGMSPVWETWVRAPLAKLMRKTTMELEYWFSARRNCAVGSMAKWRGSLPPVGTVAISR